MFEAASPDGHPESHPRTRRGYELGHKSEIALLLIAAAGGQQVRLADIPAADRRYVNSKAHILEAMALIACEYPDSQADILDHSRTYSLTDLGRTAVDVIRAASR